MSDSHIRITEIFLSLQGEARLVGRPTVFVRLTGCPLRCSYCDSEYAFYGGDKMSLAAVMEKVSAYNVGVVCVTGGEPLAQPSCLDLLDACLLEGYEVSLETSGAMDISKVNQGVSVVMDIKTPSSGEVNKNLSENVAFLRDKDQVKFIIADRKDYDWSVFKVDELQLTERVGEVLFSPSYEIMEARQLADWIVQDRLKVRFQVQLHKLLWGDTPGV